MSRDGEWVDGMFERKVNRMNERSLPALKLLGAVRVNEMGGGSAEE